MKIFGLKNCDSCRRALKDLRAAGFAPVMVDVRVDGIAPETLEQLFVVFGQDLVNRRSTTWRSISEAARAGEPVALLLANPSLMKRPVVVGDDGVQTLGWGKDAQKHWI